jgi:hypothetical protein
VTPFRRHLVGLPLQRSLFSRIDRLPELLGLAGVLPADRLRAWLSDDGHLYLERRDIQALDTALEQRLTPALIDELCRSLAAACDALEQTTACGARLASKAEAPEARALLALLGDRVATLIPYGLLSKFVPDTVYRVLVRREGVDIPLDPRRSPGAALTLEMHALYLACCDRELPPARLLREWPAVPAGIAAVLQAFCAAHAGFGPLRWEAPGFEDPHYTLAMLAATFGDDDGSGGRLPSAPTIGPCEIRLSAPESPLRRALAAWLDFLERETWYVRRAFYVAIVPLLRRLAALEGIGAEDLLFLEIAELTSPMALENHRGPAQARRARYFEQTSYLSENGITRDRLRALLAAA